MMVLVTYDVNTEDRSGQKRLRRIARLCVNHGQRVQKSLFECVLDGALWTSFRAKLVAEIDGRHDSLRFYFLGDNWQRRVEHVGMHETYDPEAPLLV